MPQQQNEEIGIFQRRKIEAQIIKPIYEAMKRELGIEKAMAIIEEVINKAALEAGKAFADQIPNGASMQSFVNLQYLWEKDSALEVEVIKNNHEQYHYDVKRCRYAEMYQEMGLGEIGHLLSCNRDRLFIEGYNSDIHLDRPHTIMSGDGFCDFRYTLKKEKSGGK